MPDTLLKFLTGPVLIETPVIFSWMIFLFAFGVFLFHPVRAKSPEATAAFERTSNGVYFCLLGAVALFRFFISFFETVLQYYVWEKNPLTKILLTQPLGAEVPIPGFIRKIFFDNSPGYFLHYAWGHFFLNVFLSLLSAAVFYFILVSLRKYRERFFGEGEILLGTLMAFVAGWPNVVLFIPLALILTAIFSLARRMFWGESYTRLAWSFLISGCAMLLFGKFLIKVFRLGVLG